MGRTKRRRSKRKKSEGFSSMDHELSIINLMKWLVQNRWRNDTCLGLRNFSQTGRGVTSLKRVKENDILISVPYDLMITYTTLQENIQEMISPQSHVLKIHDLLALFIMTEKQKGKSLWKPYIDSLPLVVPPLPWLATQEEIDLYPVDLQIISEKNRENFTESMCRVKKSIRKHNGCVLDENLFKWGYVLVNTRAVYVDPQIVMASDLSLGSMLIDQPSMALCPFLDMFNHHFLAKTEAGFTQKEGKPVFELKTLTNHKKYEQIFISYGSHDNVKLLMEYGFFIPDNILDTIQFNFSRVLNILNVNLDQRRYKLIMHHNFNSDLYIGYNGISFNLKALLFVVFNEDCQNYSSVIFSDIYPEHFLKNLTSWIIKMLEYKVKDFENDYRKLNEFVCIKSDNAKVLESFLKYRIEFVSYVRNKVCS